VRSIEEKLSQLEEKSQDLKVLFSKVIFDLNNHAGSIQTTYSEMFIEE
jgi:hypothetical protein